jgi:hypothetical protein
MMNIWRQRGEQQNRGSTSGHAGCLYGFGVSEAVTAVHRPMALKRSAVHQSAISFVTRNRGGFLLMI